MMESPWCGCGHRGCGPGRRSCRRRRVVVVMVLLVDMLQVVLVVVVVVVVIIVVVVVVTEVMVLVPVVVVFVMIGSVVVVTMVLFLVSFLISQCLQFQDKLKNKRFLWSYPHRLTKIVATGIFFYFHLFICLLLLYVFLLFSYHIFSSLSADGKKMFFPQAGQEVLQFLCTKIN